MKELLTIISETPLEKERKRGPSPYGFESDTNCGTCQLKMPGFFCQLSPSALKDFSAIQLITSYPHGAMLFIEGQASHGVFLLCAGQVKISTSTSSTRSLIVGIANPGELLGLMPTLTKTSYNMTAETFRPSQIAYIRRDDFLQFVTGHPEAYPGIVQQLHIGNDRMLRRLRNIRSSKAAHKRIGGLLLEWADGAHGESRVTVPFTHEEIGEIVGACREAVTRGFGRLIDEQLVVRKGASLVIPDRSALENFVAD